mmetsp:Transcript_67273/g.194553  ORF Transcript_67273/g.194553 Transcript_67273/m.194553 type:complete len:273 (+) Transcript_67273:543-1361(+)
MGDLLPIDELPAGSDQGMPAILVIHPPPLLLGVVWQEWRIPSLVEQCVSPLQLPSLGYQDFLTVASDELAGGRAAGVLQGAGRASARRRLVDSCLADASATLARLEKSDHDVAGLPLRRQRVRLDHRLRQCALREDQREGLRDFGGAGARREAQALVDMEVVAVRRLMQHNRRVDADRHAVFLLLLGDPVGHRRARALRRHRRWRNQDAQAHLPNAAPRRHGRGAGLLPQNPRPYLDLRGADCPQQVDEHISLLPLVGEELLRLPGKVESHD